MTTAEGNRHTYSLSANAGPELGFCPALEVEEHALYLTREDADCLVLAYSYTATSNQPVGWLQELAQRILGHHPLGEEFLLANGFRREYGARGEGH
jgi:hypothetical protein